MRAGPLTATALALATSCGTTSARTTGAGGSLPSAADCAVDGDCPGGRCVALTPGGARVCRFTPQPVTSCGPGEMGCCDSAACPAGERCFPPVGYCGGLVGPMNRCLRDGCVTDEDCAADAGICALAGDLGLFVNTCVAAAHCQRDADCSAGPGGVCRPLEDPCCHQVFALWCWYPGGCTASADCDGGACGDPATGAATCVPRPTCPL